MGTHRIPHFLRRSTPARAASTAPTAPTTPTTPPLRHSAAPSPTPRTSHNVTQLHQTDLDSANRNLHRAEVRGAALASQVADLERSLEAARSSESDSANTVREARQLLSSAAERIQKLEHNLKVHTAQYLSNTNILALVVKF